jgi:glycosyltransferase involved in cell wall biosynthesis
VKRRLLLLVYQVGAAGMEQQMLHLAEALARRGDEVTVGSFGCWVDVSSAEAAGVRFVSLGRPRRRRDRIRAAPLIARLARERDLVHCTGWDASLWGRVGGILARRPVIVTDHSPDRAVDVSHRGKRRDRVIAWHNRVLDPLTYATVAVAERQVSVLRGEGVAEDRIVQIPNGVPVAALRSAAAQGPSRADLGIPDGAKVVLQVARFEPQKRHHVTLETVRRLREELGDDIHAVFCGIPGKTSAEFEQRVADVGGDWVHLLGQRGDIPGLLALADVAVLPSSAEALPMAVLEAMAVGTPQVATAVGEVGAILQSCGAGLVVDSDDLDGFAAAVRDILTDDAVAERLRAGALQCADGFDETRMTDRYAALFDAAIAGRPPTTAANVRPQGL